jgi:AcrR family transcriptional regulator
MKKRRDKLIREKIVDASIESFLEKGFRGTRITDLAEAAGVAKSTIYNHFSSKEEILDSILDRYSKEFVNEAIREMGKCNGTLLDKFLSSYRYTGFGEDFGFNLMVDRRRGTQDTTDTRRKIEQIQERYIDCMEILFGKKTKKKLVETNVDG